MRTWILAWLLLSATSLFAHHRPADSPWRIWEASGGGASPRIVADGSVGAWEWEETHIEDDLENMWWLNISTENDAGDPVFLNQNGNPGTAHDPVDLQFAIILGWQDLGSETRLYFAFNMIDDFHVVDPDYSGDGLCGGSDSVWIEVDVDGRGVQRSKFSWFGWPPREEHEWHKAPDLSSTWRDEYGASYDEYPYSCCWYAYEYDGYELDLERGAVVDADLTSEWFITYFNDVDPDSPDISQLPRLEYCEVISIGISVCDTDPGIDEDTLWRFSPGGSANAERLPQWQLVLYPACGTMISDTTWGRIKASLQSLEAGTSP